MSGVLIPPDYSRCQAEITPAHGPFVLGPRPKAERCPNVPVWLAVEVEPGKDGRRGAMCLCESCKEVMMTDLKHADLQARVRLEPIKREEVPA